MGQNRKVSCQDQQDKGEKLEGSEKEKSIKHALK